MDGEGNDQHAEGLLLKGVVEERRERDGLWAAHWACTRFREEDGGARPHRRHSSHATHDGDEWPDGTSQTNTGRTPPNNIALTPCRPATSSRNDFHLPTWSLCPNLLTASKHLPLDKSRLPRAITWLLSCMGTHRSGAVGTLRPSMSSLAGAGGGYRQRG
ncbi:hypothetical protein P154DRAFT_614555 [Amniculicola lignicola CBS 123094]|uniref:Uncharacterized protein n=1 Tax=Amniculicola lignicola CBS 123094 TaxID=1392246 RepID=A0A6A5X5X5_9PLEO|nr:hypothetical protein P154DRAFT_614555 [Amniculicola lignicola CBS 123094]